MYYQMLLYNYVDASVFILQTASRFCCQSFELCEPFCFRDLIRFSLDLYPTR